MTQYWGYLAENAVNHATTAADKTASRRMTHSARLITLSFHIYFTDNKVIAYGIFLSVSPKQQSACVAVKLGIVGV
jgi:hypothetical protein